MRKIMYKIMYAHDAARMEKKVNDAIAAGYIPTGGVSAIHSGSNFGGPSFCQAVVKADVVYPQLVELGEEQVTADQGTESEKVQKKK